MPMRLQEVFCIFIQKKEVEIFSNIAEKNPISVFLLLNL